MENDLKSLGEILSKDFTDERIKNICKISTFFSFWGDIVGRKFEKKSKPQGIKFNKLFVACENSFVVQELIMFKKEILQKLFPYAKGLDIEIKDIVFSYKDWVVFNDNQEEKYQNQSYDKKDFDKVSLDENEINKIKDNIDKITYLNDFQKEKYFENIKNSLKTRILRKQED